VLLAIFKVQTTTLNAQLRWNIHEFIRNTFCSLEWLGFQGGTEFCSMEVFPNSTVEKRLEDDVHARFYRIVEGSDAAAFRIGVGVGVALYVHGGLELVETFLFVTGASCCPSTNRPSQPDVISLGRVTD
jgi:hypothetical protein